MSRKTQFTIAACFLFLGILMLWIYKFPFLHLPFFWDEAWSYAPAISTMYKNHPCLLPGCLPADLYRGHPLWFYFMNATVAKIFGFSPLVMHVFSLIIASAFLVAFFFILQQYTMPVFALLGTLLLLSQDAFIVQSSFMLPEIFISMLIMLAVFFLVTGRNVLYFLSATLLVLTKESGLVIISALVFAAFIGLIKQQMKGSKKSLSSVVKYLFLISSPLLIGIAFYVFQKRTYGWYFYPLHIQMMNFNLEAIWQDVLLIRVFVFLGYGRKILVVLLGLIIILLIFYGRRLKTSISPGIIKITWSMLTLFAFYVFFSATNYLMLRYLIPLIVIFIFLLTIWGNQLHQWGFRLLPYLFCVVIALSLYHDYTFEPSWIDDVSLNYKDDVVVDQQAVSFMENRQAQSKKILIHSLSAYNFTHPELFYLHGPSFKNVSLDSLLKSADYYIFSNLNTSYYDYVKSNDSLQLIKRFEKGKAWCEIYERK
ncbi:MAG TPA: hypothetical protein VE978_16135 [Chitinophagales bacterium]|nr:hypothetical protein [Chitinophagales bacterium]